MAANNRKKDWLWTYGIEIAAIPFSFAPNGVSAISAASTKGPVTVTRSDTGIFSVALAGGAPQILAITLMNESTTKTALCVESTSVSATAGTFALRTMTVGTTTLVDIAANAGNRINGVVWVQNCSYTRS